MDKFHLYGNIKHVNEDMRFETYGAKPTLTKQAQVTLVLWLFVRRKKQMLAEWTKQTN